MPHEPLVLSDLLSLHPDLALAWRAAATAGAFLRDERPRELLVDTKSTPTDAVSAMDRGAERLIVDMVLATCPDDGFLGEEGGERNGSTGRRWVVDPLDGTVNYLFRIPLWGVSVALEDAAGSVVGVVTLPDQDVAYVAVRGSGAWRVAGGEVRRLHGSACADLSMALVATGFGYSAARRTRQAEILASVIGHVRDVRRSGCAVVDFCWLADGRIDAFYEYGLNAWDHAAGALIARESGAVITPLGPDGAIGPFFVAAAPGIAAGLSDLLLAAGADVMP